MKHGLIYLNSKTSCMYESGMHSADVHVGIMYTAN